MVPRFQLERQIHSFHFFEVLFGSTLYFIQKKKKEKTMSAMTQMRAHRRITPPKLPISARKQVEPRAALSMTYYDKGCGTQGKRPLRKSIVCIDHPTQVVQTFPHSSHAHEIRTSLKHSNMFPRQRFWLNSPPTTKFARTA